jgi:hypothetical protein
MLRLEYWAKDDGEFVHFVLLGLTRSGPGLLSRARVGVCSLQ